MSNNDFVYWLMGFLDDKASLNEDQIGRIHEQIGEISEPKFATLTASCIEKREDGPLVVVNAK